MGSSQSCPKCPEQKECPAQQQCPKCDITLTDSTKVTDIVDPVLKRYTPEDADIWAKYHDQVAVGGEKSLMSGSLNSFVVKQVNEFKKSIADKKTPDASTAPATTQAPQTTQTTQTTTKETFGMNRNFEFFLIVIFLLYVFLRK
jgi:hypothetical protein